MNFFQNLFRIFFIYITIVVVVKNFFFVCILIALFINFNDYFAAVVVINFDKKITVIGYNLEKKICCYKKLIYYYFHLYYYYNHSNYIINEFDL